jgi:hypothetical protein
METQKHNHDMAQTKTRMHCRVYKKQSRPVFPSGVPAPYSQLACSCWEVDVLLRPSFATIRTRLQVR